MARSKDKGLKGLGGWLILLQIFLWPSAIGFVFEFYFVGFSFLRFIVFTFVATSLIYMYDRDKLFIKWAKWTFTLWIIGGMLSSLARIGEASITGMYDITTITMSIIELVIGIVGLSYLEKSERVKNTFVN